MKKSIFFPLAVSLLLVSCQRRDITVVVSNAKPNSIQNLEIAFAGGVLKSPILLPGGQQQFRILPRAPSHLTLSFTDSEGVQNKKEINVYFEGGYSGRISLSVMPSGEVTCKDEMTVAK